MWNMNKPVFTPVFTVTRLAMSYKGANVFHVQSDIFLSDGNYKASLCMLEGNRLVPVPGFMRISSGLTLTLGPVSLPKVIALEVAQEVTL
jgi:hypothetical protein